MRQETRSSGLLVDVIDLYRFGRFDLGKKINDNKLDGVFLPRAETLNS